MAVAWLVQNGKRVKVKMEDEILPNVKEKTEEAIRVRQRRRWERQHGAHENPPGSIVVEEIPDDEPADDEPADGEAVDGEAQSGGAEDERTDEKPDEE